MPLLALADVATPPFPGLDFLSLGFPRGLVALVVAVGATIGLVVFLRKRQIHGGLVALAAVLLFLAADCTAYYVGEGERREARARFRAEHMRPPPSPPPTATASGEP
jgi:hypothetical protein